MARAITEKVVYIMADRKQREDRKGPMTRYYSQGDTPPVTHLFHLGPSSQNSAMDQGPSI
jgi:hypothetical protein